MLRLLFLSMVSALLLAGCASTGMYSAPSGAQAATLSVDNQLSAPTDQGGHAGWQMPTSSDAKASLFKVDGDRITEQGGTPSVQLEAGKHSVEVFADQGGILRFGKFRHTFLKGGIYQVRILAAEGNKDYALELVKASDPDDVLVSKEF
ncbi:hypothetical protein [Alcanivorax sp.]|jgi:nitrous oxide reductase accessory protein NosL|uniref:hypothetical protein n=1 Tax=Alcanivorax sp. TaxID=1872427 RepID=UPI0032D9A159